ncbi:MAG: polysaccharide biosynthesis C-terminal domain-containing protein, partial [Candidatus Portnoybacteria bacterium]|nr:polysaccharide biosynthesis C-terminal domain-containing protein [Candidatus Portnoybacteria bacterium]
LAAILTMVYFSFDTLILSIWQPAETVGIYRLSYKVLESLIFFPAMFAGLIMPIFSQAAWLDKERFCRILQKSQEILLIFAVPLVLGTLIVSPKVVALLGGGNYPEAAAVLNILIVATGFIFLSTLFSYALIALGKQKINFKISFGVAIVSLAFNFGLIPYWSYWAAAWSHVLTEFLVAAAMLLALKRLLGFFPSFKIVFRCLAAALPMAALLWWWREQNIFCLLAAAVFVYFGLLYLFKGFSAKELFSLVKKSV